MTRYIPIALMAAGILLAAGLFWLGHATGYDAAYAQQQAVIHEMQADNALALAGAEKSARKTESDLRDQLDLIQQGARRLELEAESEAKEQDRIIANLRAGTQRMSIAVRSCRAGAEGEAGDDPASAPGGRPGASRAEFYPETIRAIFDIGNDANRNTRERNICIAAYNRVRARINGGEVSL